jgi:hypothetical protein
MPETQPRVLTAAELELLSAPPSGGADSAPLAVPPGTQVPVHLLDPAAAADAAAVEPAGPTQGPPDAGARDRR